MELEDKILDYINQNTDGIKISEMEKPLSENRMKLGCILNNLVNEGKIIKVSDKYYPKNTIRNSKNKNFQINNTLNNQLIIN